ncbi:MAG TPA: glycine cleavage system protein GcvH [Pseudomonadota bacterium]|jgi:glycine cleavage system H protein|nr:glycine cleavage system protein GcvH [Pseudomonadota bacterium]
MSNFPSDLRYTKDHEWARIDGKRAVMGITDFAVHQLGDITLVDLPKEGESFRREQVLGTIESVKAVSDIYSPLSGKVTKTNDPLRDSPEILNEDCYDEGWMVELEMSNPDEAKDLMTSEEYAQYVKAQG